MDELKPITMPQDGSISCTHRVEGMDLQKLFSDLQMTTTVHRCPYHYMHTPTHSHTHMCMFACANTQNENEYVNLRN